MGEASRVPASICRASQWRRWRICPTWSCLAGASRIGHRSQFDADIAGGVVGCPSEGFSAEAEITPASRWHPIIDGIGRFVARQRLPVAPIFLPSDASAREDDRRRRFAGGMGGRAGAAPSTRSGTLTTSAAAISPNCCSVRSVGPTAGHDGHIGHIQSGGCKQHVGGQVGHPQRCSPPTGD